MESICELLTNFFLVQGGGYLSYCTSFQVEKKEKDQAIKKEEKLAVKNILIWETRGTS